MHHLQCVCEGVGGCTGVLYLWARGAGASSFTRVGVSGAEITEGRAWSFTEGAWSAQETLGRVCHTCITH